MKRILLGASLLLSSTLFAQRKLAVNDSLLLNRIQDTLSDLGGDILEDSIVTDRIRNDDLFTRSLVRALKMPNSFYYPFDSVETMTIQYPKDSSFRIFTWHYEIDEQTFRQKGAIQKNIPDGSLSLFPLFDASEYGDEPNDTVRQASNWIGAIYYKIIQNQLSNGQKVYTLLGYDENGLRSTKKWVDILTFGANGQPQFGGDYFNFGGNDSLWQRSWKRFNIEFKKEGRARLTYDDEKGVIVFDHLVSESKEPEKKYTYIPDGDFEGLKWQNGKWTYVENVLEGIALKEGNEPRPDLLMDDAGGINEGKLNEQSEKNADKKVQAKQIKRNVKVKTPANKPKG